MALTTASMLPTEAASAPTAAPLSGPQLSPDLQKAIAKVTEISSLPEVTTKIIAVVEDPKSTAQDMHDIVKNDPALAAKVLKVVNSAFYGLPTQISSLDRAIVMLGLSAVKNLAMAASLARMFKPGQLSENFDARDLWTHCVAVGTCARLLADQAGGNAEDAFVGGMVHDMGLLIEYQLFPEKLKEVVQRVEADKTLDFCTIERELIGADHQAFGNHMATKWKFPPGLRACIAFHHGTDGFKVDHKRVVGLVRLADMICCQNELGFYLTACAGEVTADMLTELGLSEDQVGSVIEIMPERLEEAQAIFKD